MSTINYRLKKGYIAQFDIPFKGIKAFSNTEMTDEIAKEYLERHPSRIIYFEKYPSGATVIPAGIKIVEPPKKKEAVAETNPEIEIIKPNNPLDETVKNLMEEPKIKTLSQMNKAELVAEAIKYPAKIENPEIYNNFDLANLIRRATGVKELVKKSTKTNE